jgi:hypothetical protein
VSFRSKLAVRLQYLIRKALNRERWIELVHAGWNQ